MMNLDQALSEAVLGERVRAVDMPEGVYIDYQFNGWRINFPSGSSSGYSIKEHDKTVEWEVWVKPEPVNVGWGDFTPPPAPAPKRRGRKPSFTPPAVIDDVEYGEPKPETKPSNPWAEAGLTGEEKPATGWAIFNKG